jgi:hypothetical protein
MPVRIQTVNRYLDLMDQGKAPAIFCGNDKQHGRVFARLSDEENVELWCLACDYRCVVGLAMFDSMTEVCWIYDGVKSGVSED